jgi:DNA mismatch repair protein MutL
MLPGMGSHIHVLPSHVANKIAAGEVVERPASVLKELLENAIDAGAGRIDVEIDAGGRKRVSVTDNGSGMNRDDALLSIERQATSKIRDVDDIERIATLGFRGEALAAVASVSRFRLVSRDAGSETGTDVRVAGGTLHEVLDAGGPVGASVEVRDLFFNVPARRKFLRSAQTELAHLRHTFIVTALAHPNVAFTLQIDGQRAFELPAGRREDRIRDAFGPDYLKNLRPIQERAGDVRVTGYAGLPSYARSDRNEQYCFINGRASGAPVLAFAVREAYHGLIPKDRHPAVFLYIEMDPTLVDVNVHPTKREVRFRRPADVRDTVMRALRDALSEPDRREPDTRREVNHLQPPTPKADDAQLRIADLPVSRAFRYPRRLARDGVLPGEQASTSLSRPAPTDPGAGPVAATDAETTASAPNDAPWSWCRVLGQIGGLFVVLETEDGMVLMDPHAAHERVLFERLMRQFREGAIPAQSLLIPETVELAPRDALRVRENVQALREMGFGVAEFGGDGFVVDALPATIGAAPAREVLLQVAHDLEQAGARGARGRWKEEAIAQAACKAAVKARDRSLTLDEIERLVVDLAGAEMPYTCPHGRPTVVHMSFHDIRRKFGRE